MLILGSGPNRIGQGLEFDYCCVHAAMTFRALGYAAIMVNCNPETVSTDYDTSDRLYFEPLTIEDVLEIVEVEQRAGVVNQFGGRRRCGLAKRLIDAGVPILGTPFHAIDLAEDRQRFGSLLDSIGLKAPAWAIASNPDEAAAAAAKIGYPVLVRPSYVLGGRAMRICYDEEMLRSGPIASSTLVDSFVEDAIEIDVDAVSDGDDVLIGAVMEHVEEAGIHSGDSACVIPAARDRRRRRGRGAAADARARAGAGRGRARQRAVRGPRRRGVRDRGEPARVAHRAVRRQGHGHAAGGGRLPRRARRPHRRPRPARDEPTSCR